MLSSGVEQGDIAYGGDLNGELWRFDLSSTNPAEWTVSKMAKAKDASGNNQPITAPPELAIVNKKRLVIFGTGKLLELSDLTNNNVQSIYAVTDPMNGSSIADGGLRASLQRQTITVGAGGVRTATTTSVDWATQRGWYFDLPAGEMSTNAMSLNFGVLALTTNNPDQTLGCRGALSFLYQLDVVSGGQLPESFYGGTTPWAGKALASAYASAPTVVVTRTGKLTTLVHETGGKILGATLSPANPRTVKKIGWSEIVR